MSKYIWISELENWKLWNFDKPTPVSKLGMPPFLTQTELVTFVKVLKIAYYFRKSVLMNLCDST